MGRFDVRTVLTGALLSALLVGGCATAVEDRGTLGHVPPPGEAQAILDVIHVLFDAMASKDGNAIRSVFTEDALLMAPAPAGSTEAFRTVDVEQFVQAITSVPDRVLERMWDPEVRQNGEIATVWAPYDLYVGERFIHCGIDAFSLVREAEGWRIAFVSYTAFPDREGCPEHPEGPPF